LLFAPIITNTNAITKAVKIIIPNRISSIMLPS